MVFCVCSGLDKFLCLIQKKLLHFSHFVLCEE